LRRKVVNLAQSDFEDILTPAQAARLDIVNNEYLQTVMVFYHCHYCYHYHSYFIVIGRSS